MFSLSESEKKNLTHSHSLLFSLTLTHSHSHLQVYPTGGAYSAPPDPLAGLRGPTSKGRGEGKRRGGEGSYF